MDIQTFIIAAFTATLFTCISAAYFYLYKKPRSKVERKKYLLRSTIYTITGTILVIIISIVIKNLKSEGIKYSISS